jgi:hypothetical protein
MNEKNLESHYKMMAVETSKANKTKKAPDFRGLFCKQKV